MPKRLDFTVVDSYTTYVFSIVLEGLGMQRFCKQYIYTDEGISTGDQRAYPQSYPPGGLSEEGRCDNLIPRAAAENGASQDAVYPEAGQAGNSCQTGQRRAARRLEAGEAAVLVWCPWADPGLQAAYAPFIPELNDRAFQGSGVRCPGCGD